MTDPTTTDPDVEAAFTQLRDPGTLLAEALVRVRRADEHMRDAPSDTTHLVDRARHEIDASAALSTIVDTVIRLAADERAITMRAVDEFLDDPEDRTVPPRDLVREAVYQPLALNGVRFTADLRGHYMGIVAGLAWLHVSGHGFIDITDARQYDGPPGGPGFMLRGRVVSATPDHVLCIPDGSGTSVTLPRALIVESPDE
jgi:hypothetical protein